MSTRGKFIVLEGIDGSGKGTQLEMLARAFESRGIAFNRVSFPRYVGFFGKLVANFLNGEFGPLDDVDPHFSAMLYAGDRWEVRPTLEADLAAGRAILADRYVASNLAHQGARVAPEKRAEFLAWLKEFEYRVYALPSEDLAVYLRVPAQEAQRLVGEKAKRDYTELQRDLLESNLDHLESASEVYDELARQPNWVTIECYEAAARALRAPEEIHQEILTAIEARLFPALQARC
jgi:dTMP kinase